MPTFDLKGIKCGAYASSGGVTTYSNQCHVGDAMTASIDLTFAEGRLYAEGGLAEYMRKATGGNISMGVKYIKTEAQKVMLGKIEKTRTIGDQEITGLMNSAATSPCYVGVAFYAPDLIDGQNKFTCIFLRKCLFGPPSMAFNTAGDSITFNTPTVTGAIMPDEAEDRGIDEVAIVDDLETAIAWVDAVLGIAADAGGV